MRRIGQIRKSRYRRAVRIAVVVIAVAVLAGCGGKSQVTLAGCLDDAGFLVTESGRTVDGTTPRGVGFTLTAYDSAAAARRAAAGLPRRTTAVAGTGVVDYRGNPGAHPRVTPGELATIRGCLEKTRA